MRTLTTIEEKKFEEERVRLMLLYLFPEKYKGSVLGESPDIVCEANKIGMEVTSCRKPCFREKDSLAGQITGKTIAQLTEKEKQLIKSRDIVFRIMQDGHVLAGYAEWGDENDVPQILRKKLVKLKNVYQKYKTNELFITAWFCDDTELSEIAQQVNDINFSEDICFTRIYLCREMDGSVEVNEFDKNTWTKYLIDKTMMNYIYNKAKNNVVGEPV